MDEYLSTRNPWSDNKKLTVVNFFGGPGVGKSTTASAVFTRMRKEGYKVELVPEVTKDMIWEEANHLFGEQDYIFALQHRMLRRLTRHDVDYAIVEGPILMTLFYYPNDFPQSFKPFVEEVFDSYDNINIFIDRHDSIPYDETGRNETKEQASAIDERMLEYLEGNQERINIRRVRAGISCADTSYRIVKRHANPL